MAQINLEVTLTARQYDCYQKFWDPNIRSILFGGARGGGKTFLGCFLTFQYAVEAIRQFSLKSSKYPPPVAFMGRARGVDFVDTTLETWKSIIPSEIYTIRSHEREIVIQDTVKILYGGLDNQEDINKFKSGELGMFFLDQAEECTRDAVADLRGCLRKKINGKPLLYKELYTANPAQCWLKDEFVRNQDDPTKAFIQALPGDNPYLPDGYVERLKDAYGHRPELLSAYLYGSWNAFDQENVLIPERQIIEAKSRPNIYEGFWVIGCDVARYGNDQTVIYVLNGTDIVDHEVLTRNDTMQIAGTVAILAKKYRVKLCGVDVIGIGAGVVDRLRELGVDVLEVNFAQKASESRFRNLRAEAWWKLSELFSQGKICLTTDDHELVRELSSVTYEINYGQVVVEDKDNIRRKLGKSIDKADAYVIGIYALMQVTQNGALTRGETREYYDYFDLDVGALYRRYSGL